MGGSSFIFMENEDLEFAVYNTPKFSSLDRHLVVIDFKASILHEVAMFPDVNIRDKEEI